MKNAKLRAERGIGFEDVVFNFQRGDLVDTGNTRIPAVTAASPSSSCGARSTCYLVPFVKDEHTVFLKTILPSRRATKQYLGEESDDEDDADEKELLDCVEPGEWKAAKGGKRERAR